MDNLLVVQDLRVTYGGVTAVDKVSLTVNEGEIVGLIGPNGAGKSSLIDALTGYHPAAGGQVIFDWVPITGARPYRIARRGLIRTFQSVELFDDLTVEENLLVAAEQPSPWSVLRDLVAPPRPRRNENVAWALDACGLDDVTDRAADQLSHGRRKLVGVARALAMRPRLVLMDEPAAGLDNDESIAFGERVARCRPRGQRAACGSRHGPGARAVRPHRGHRFRQGHRVRYPGRDPGQPRRSSRPTWGVMVATVNGSERAAGSSRSRPSTPGTTAIPWSAT